MFCRLLRLWVFRTNKKKCREASSRGAWTYFWNSLIRLFRAGAFRHHATPGNPLSRVYIIKTVFALLKKPRPLAKNTPGTLGNKIARGRGKNDPTVFKNKNGLYYVVFYVGNFLLKTHPQLEFKLLLCWKKLFFGDAKNGLYYVYP